LADSAVPRPPDPGTPQSLAADDDGRLADALAGEVTTAACALHDAATAASIPFRFIGSIAIIACCPDHRSVLACLGRRPVRDIDAVVYSRDDTRVRRLFEELGYRLDPAIVHSQEFGIKRLIYHDPSGRYKADVFLDQLVMAHTVDLRNRLELTSPTVTLVDLLLSKLQIHEITENDLIDLAVLLAEHDPGPGGTIDLGYLAGIMARDWGFHRTAADNLHMLRLALDRFTAMPAASAAAARRRIEIIEAAMEAVRKSRIWRLRARIGTRMRWYEDVTEVDPGSPAGAGR
jgi:hypothetical protein